jgi:hypothetical protein
VAACARWRGLGVLQSSRRGPLDSPTARHGVGGGGEGYGEAVNDEPVNNGGQWHGVDFPSQCQ